MKKQIYIVSFIIFLSFTSLLASEGIYENRGSIITSDDQVIAYLKDGKREFPHKNSMEPLLGYVDANLRGNKGLERFLNPILAEEINVRLTIDLSLQKNIEKILDSYKEKLQADEILAAVMDSTSGKVLAMADSNRYNPARIRQKDIADLVPKFTEYPYEVGDVLKPLSIAVAMEHDYITPNTWFNTFDGRMQMGENLWVTDSQKHEFLNVTDIIVSSSSIGTVQVAWELTGTEFRDGLLKFGLGKPSGIDLVRDHAGVLKSVQKLDNKLHRASTSCGYAMMATFTQLMKAYAAFNNDGIAVTPRLVDSLVDNQGQRYIIKPKMDNTQAISKRTVDQMHNILLEVVKRGTAINAQYEGLEIGGKTGTAHIAKNGRYVREYHSSFYGFANDKKGNRYTIGVMIIRPKAPKMYFASKSAAPIFREVVNEMVDAKYLMPHKSR